MSDVEGVFDQLVNMNLLDLKKLMDLFSDRLGIVPSAAVAVAAPVAGGAAAVEEKKEFAIMLKSYDSSKKLAAIKIIREIKSLGLKEGKDFVESSIPGVLDDKKYPKEQAEEICKKLEEAGIVAAAE